MLAAHGAGGLIRAGSILIPATPNAVPEAAQVWDTVGPLSPQAAHEYPLPVGMQRFQLSQQSEEQNPCIP